MIRKKGNTYNNVFILWKYFVINISPPWCFQNSFHQLYQNIFVKYLKEYTHSNQYVFVLMREIMSKLKYPSLINSLPIIHAIHNRECINIRNNNSCINKAKLLVKK